MVVHSYYLDDTRVRREAEALIDAGFLVDVICLNEGDEVGFEEYNGVRIHRCNIGRSTKRTKVSYISEYVSFFFKSFFKSTKLSFKVKYDVFFYFTIQSY